MIVHLKKILQRVDNTMQKGVTLIELLVVIAIFSVIASVMLFNFSDFSTNATVRNLSQDIAIAVRKAQTYATSVRKINGTNLNTTQYTRFGMVFSASKAIAANQPNYKQFVLFSKSDADSYLYQQDEKECGTIIDQDNNCVEVFTINTSDSIVELCYQESSSYETCSRGSTVATVLFKRPIPDATICIGIGNRCKYSPYLKIKVESAKGVQKTIQIWNTGQISVI